MSETFDREAHEIEMREFRWREGIVKREVAEALHHWLRVLCPDDTDPAEHARWIQLLAERTVDCLTSFYGGNHPWYAFESAPEALVLAVHGRPETRGPFHRLTIEHEPSCAGVGDEGWRLYGHCQCHLRVRRDA
jgi:hypothetical protein